jgi:hypothetical protein
MQALAGESDVVWVGDQNLPTSPQGLVLLGTPTGQNDFLQIHLATTRANQDKLLTMIGKIPELQTAWLILSMCAATRVTYFLRALPPSSTHVCAQHHDEMADFETAPLD